MKPYHSPLFSRGHQRAGEGAIPSRVSHPPLIPASPYRPTGPLPPYGKGPEPVATRPPAPRSIAEALDELDAELEGHMRAEERKKRDREEKERQRREEERQRKEAEIRRKRDEERRKELEKAEEERKKRELDRREEEERRRKEWERQEQERKRMREEEERRREVEWLEKKKREWERQEEERRKKEAERQEEEEKKKAEEQRKERELKRKEEEERQRKEQQEKEARGVKGSPPPPPLSDPRPPGSRASPPYPWRWAERSRPPPLTPQTEHAREKQRQREMAGGATRGPQDRERDGGRRPPPAAALGELPKLYRAFPREAPPPPPPPGGAQFEEEPSEQSALLPDGLADIMAMLDESIKKEEEELRNGEGAGPVDGYPPAPDLVPATRTALGREEPGRNPHASPPVLSRQGSSASPRSRASSLEDDDDEEEEEEEEYHASVRRSAGHTDYRHSDLAKLYGLPERSKSEAEEEYDEDDSETPSCSPPQRPHLHQTGVSGAFKSLAALLESQKYAYRGGPFGRPPPSALVGVKYSSSLSLGPDVRRQTEPVGPAVPPEREKATEDEPAGEKEEVTEDAEGREEGRPPPASEGGPGTTKERKEKGRNEEKKKPGRSKKREKREKEKRESAPGSSSGGSSRDRKRRKEGKSRKEKERRILGDLNLQSKDRTDKSRRKKKREAAPGLVAEGKPDFPPKELKIRLIKVESGDGETFIASEVEEKRIPLEDIGIHNTAGEIIRSCK